MWRTFWSSLTRVFHLSYLLIGRNFRTFLILRSIFFDIFAVIILTYFNRRNFSERNFREFREFWPFSRKFVSRKFKKKKFIHWYFFETAIRESLSSEILIYESSPGIHVFFNKKPAYKKRQAQVCQKLRYVKNYLYYLRNFCEF